MTAYATRKDVYRYGLPRGSLGNPGRLVASMLAATDTIELSEHGFVAGDAVQFRATEGGTLSAPLVAGTLYYVLPLSDSDFQVSATPLGSPINLTTDGVSVMVSADLPIDDLLEFYSRFADGFIPAEAAPLQPPYPITVVAVVAQLVAKQLQFLSGVESISMQEAELSAKAQLERWAKTLPVRDLQNRRPANLAVVRHRPDHRIGFSPRSRSGFPDDNGGNFQ